MWLFFQPVTRLSLSVFYFFLSSKIFRDYPYPIGIPPSIGSHVPLHWIQATLVHIELLGYIQIISILAVPSIVHILFQNTHVVPSISPSRSQIIWYLLGAGIVPYSIFLNCVYYVNQYPTRCHCPWQRELLSLTTLHLFFTIYGVNLEQLENPHYLYSYWMANHANKH